MKLSPWGIGFWETPGVPSDHGVSVCLVYCQRHRPGLESAANILNAMEMDSRIKGKVVVNDKLERFSSMKLWLKCLTDLYIVSIVQVQLGPWELPIAKNDISRLAIRCSDFPRKIYLKEYMGTKRKRRICQNAYSQR